VTDPLGVTHAGGEYLFHIEPGVLGRLPKLAAEFLGERRVAVIADSNVATLYRGFTDGTMAAWGTPAEAPADWDILEFPAGEASKTRETWSVLTDALLDRGYGRDSAVVALGGGVTGDLAGFVAATYARGIPLIHAPTTLLAMVDASVGGKVGVDTPHGKNLIGAFYAPLLVAADPRTLATLPDRELRAGLAEAVKHALVANAAHLDWIQSHASEILQRNAEALTELIRTSVAIKARIVAEDERDDGRRAVLNAGHTVGHALEQASGYAIPHGEAVAIGLVAEARLGEELGITVKGTADRVAGVFRALGLPTQVPPLEGEAVIAAMGHDKKSREGRPAFALLVEPGVPHRGAAGWTTEAPARAVAGVVRAVDKHGKEASTNDL
jgi:3-dehydroquinate synthase